MKNNLTKTLKTDQLPFWFNPQNELFDLVYDFDKELIEERIKSKKIEEINVLSIGAFKKDVELADIDYTIDETRELIEALGHNYVDAVTQRVDKITSSYMGKGKLEEIVRIIDEQDIDYVICNHELSTSQFKRLISEFGIPVIDKVMLVMQLFARQSHTKEARLQIEITELKYLYPKITSVSDNKNSADRAHGLFNTKGSGESVVELNQRKIKNKIRNLSDELKRVKKTKEVQGKRRSDLFKIVLVGYTSAGKTTIMNGLTKSDFSTSDRFFQTTDSYYRRMFLDYNKYALLADTVGFISDLPSSWIEGFSTTFNEIMNADLILHVIDSSSDYYQRRIRVVEDILMQIDCFDKPRIRVYNKIDSLTAVELEDIEQSLNGNIMISAIRKDDIKELRAKILSKL